MTPLQGNLLLNDGHVGQIRARHLSHKTILLALTIAAMILIQLISLRGHWEDVQAKKGDFGSLYAAGKVARLGTADYHPIERHWVAIESVSSSAYPFVDADRLHPPFETLIFATLSLLPYATAYLVWYGLNLALLWSVPIVLWPYIPGLHRDFHFISIALGSMLSVSTCLIFGQDAILLLFLLTLAYVSMEERRMVRAGIFLGLGLFKFQLVLPIVAILCLARSWKILASFLPTMACLICSSIAIVGPRQTMNYFSLVLSRGTQVSLNIPERTSTMPNIRGLISLLLGNIASSALQTILVILISAGVFGLVLLWSRANGSSPLCIRFAAFTTMASLVSYYYFVYSSVILILPLLLFANELERHSTSLWRNYAFALAALSIYLVPLISPLKVGMPAMACASVFLLALLLSYTGSLQATRSASPS